MATTTNYSWTTPDDTALVKNGAAAIRSLGTAIDTTVFNNASAAIAKTIVDAKGDIIAATAADTVARLAVGTNGQVLKANSATATGLEWGSAGGGGKSFALLNTGGTSLSGATTTISGLSGYDQFMVIIQNASSSGSNMFLQVQINSFTGPYNNAAGSYDNAGSYSVGNWINQGDSTADSWTVLKSTSAGSTSSAFLKIEGGNTSGNKIATYAGFPPGVTSQYNYWGAGVATESNVISSIVFKCTSGTAFDGGTVFIYGAV